MIDIDKAYYEFDKYVSNFDPNNGRVKLKIDHIKRVASLSKKIAQNLNLTEEKVKLAQLIGLFHDIGRFEQIKTYGTFNDRCSVNHAKLSVEVLFNNNLIDNFKVDEKYKKIIQIAILNHNKGKIDEKLKGDELLFAKIIRDADKLDIYYTICNYDFKSIFWYPNFDCGPISEAIIKDLKEDHFLDYSLIKTNSDQLPMFYAYIFDFNFDFSLKYLKDNKYLEKFTNRVYDNFSNEVVKVQITDILNFSNQFLKNI